jgi:3-hydroxy-4-methylanthranilate adenylyltransferase
MRWPAAQQSIFVRGGPRVLQDSELDLIQGISTHIANQDSHMTGPVEEGRTSAWPLPRAAAAEGKASVAAAVSVLLDPGWVDEVLLGGAGSDLCLLLGGPVTRGELRVLVAGCQGELAAAGVGRGGSVVLNLPPSLAFVANLLAVWRLGAQAALLDHRLTVYEVERALCRLAPQVVVSAKGVAGGGLRGFHEVRGQVWLYPGRPAGTGHALVQLSSGSTGPSKVIGRSAADLVAELGRYARIEGVPRAGERVVSLASMVHVLGLVGGLLYGLYAGVGVVVPGRMTAGGILAAVAQSPVPVALLGVPFHLELLAAVQDPPALGRLSGITTGGELVRPQVYEAFVDRFGVRVGNMYGMTEVGVIATDLFGRHRPALAPAPGLEVREQDGELLVAREESPYLGDTDPGRWRGGWLHTRDAGSVDPDSGLVRVWGRGDSQVSVGGLKVDLSEVEQVVAGVCGVAGAVVVFGGVIEAYLVARDPGDVVGVRERVAAAVGVRLAAYKRPRVVHVVDELPRTATGKLVRDRTRLETTIPRREATR